MRRPRLARFLGAALLAAVLLPQTAFAATTPSTTTVTPPEIKLACALVVPNPLQAVWPNRAIACKWAAPTGITVAKYRVWRSVDTGSRVLLGTVAPTAPLKWADRNIRTGHTYHYFVAGVNDAGKRVARSNVANVYVMRAPQTLLFNCVLVTDNGASWASCHWSATTRSAVRYVLYRSVDGAARQAIYRVGVHGTRTYADKDVKPGQKIRYAVVAFDKYGRVVAYSSPDTVQIPS
jgi:hypothetical protein